MNRNELIATIGLVVVIIVIIVAAIGLVVVIITMMTSNQVFLYTSQTTEDRANTQKTVNDGMVYPWHHIQ
jgi:flagellar basal body-associated protein FliL